MLQRHFLKHFATQYNKPFSGMTPRAQTLLARYSWPGNVRELENVIGHACMMAESDVIDIRDLPERIQNQKPVERKENEELLSMEQMSRVHAQRIVAHTGGNKARAAELLGISRTHLYELLKKNESEQGKSGSGESIGESALPAAKS